MMYFLFRGSTLVQRKNSWPLLDRQPSNLAWTVIVVRRWLLMILEIPCSNLYLHTRNIKDCHDFCSALNTIQPSLLSKKLLAMEVHIIDWITAWIVASQRWWWAALVNPKQLYWHKLFPFEIWPGTWSRPCPNNFLRSPISLGRVLFYCSRSVCHYVNMWLEQSWLLSSSDH